MRLKFTPKQHPQAWPSHFSHCFAHAGVQAALQAPAQQSNSSTQVNSKMLQPQLLERQPPATNHNNSRSSAFAGRGRSPSDELLDAVEADAKSMSTYDRSPERPGIAQQHVKKAILKLIAA